MDDLARRLAGLAGRARAGARDGFTIGYVLAFWGELAWAAFGRPAPYAFRAVPLTAEAWPMERSDEQTLARRTHPPARRHAARHRALARGRRSPTDVGRRSHFALLGLGSGRAVRARVPGLDRDLPRLGRAELRRTAPSGWSAPTSTGRSRSGTASRHGSPGSRASRRVRLDRCLTHVLVMRKLRRASPLARTVATLGILIVVQSAVVLRYGARVPPSSRRSCPARSSIPSA